MPTIPFAGDDSDVAMLLAYMHFPTRVRLREEFRQMLSDVDVPSAPAVAVELARQSRKVLSISDVEWRGTLAGELILRMAVMEKHSIPEPGARKAIHTLRSDLVELAADADGRVSDSRENRGIPITERSLWSYLAAFKTVCHLWAAHRILEYDVPFFSVGDALRDRGSMNLFLGARFVVSAVCRRIQGAQR